MHGGQQALFRGLVMRRLLDLGKRGYCRPIERGAIRCELRSVTRAIPALLQRVPVHDAAEMRAAGGMQMQLSLPVPACSDLLQSATHQTTLTGPQPLDGSDFVRGKVLCEIFQRRDVLADVLAEVLLDLPCRRIDIFPSAGADRDQVRDQDAGDEAVGDALSGIAADNEDMLLVRRPPDETDEIDWLQHLSRPAMGDRAHVRQSFARPLLQCCEAFLAVISLSRLVVFATDD